ncbi:hypothetical protein BH11VER1_BH11VER1_10740 [soil metagenome]
MRILQVVPRFPPQLCGVGDQSWLLGETMFRDHGIVSRFLVSSPEWLPQPATDPQLVTALHRQSDSALDLQLAHESKDISGLLIHYSGYGYAKRGAPLWLARAARRFSKNHPGIPLHVMFHELSSRGSWRSSSFWNWPLQQWIVSRLTRLASGTVFTNREDYARQIRAWLPKQTTPVQTLPVFSNLGEPEQLPAWETREQAMAFFGWPIPSSIASQFFQRLRTTIITLGVKKLHVFRHPLPTGFELPIPVETHQVLPPDSISAILNTCRYAFSDYNPFYLGKSSLLATFAAHGLTTILHEGMGVLPDGIKVGQQVLSAADTISLQNVAKFQEVANQLQAWYRTHDRRKTATVYADAIRHGVSILSTKPSA